MHAVSRAGLPRPRWSLDSTMHCESRVAVAGGDGPSELGQRGGGAAADVDDDAVESIHARRPRGRFWKPMTWKHGTFWKLPPADVAP